MKQAHSPAASHPCPLEAAGGWLGWWPEGGWRAVLDPENARIPRFLADQAETLPDDCRVLDAGAGRRPYAALLKQHDPTRAGKRGRSIASCLLWTLALLPVWACLLPVTAYLVRPLCYWMDRLDLEKSFTLGYTAVLRKPVGSSCSSA